MSYCAVRHGDLGKDDLQCLSKASEPMHTTAVHRAVERELGQPVDFRTIKACLSEEAHKPEPRLQRIAHGEYRLA